MSESPSVRVIQQRAYAPVNYGYPPVLPPILPFRYSGGTVRRDQRSIAEERNWVHVGRNLGADQYTGYYQAGGRHYEGKATISRRRLQIFVKDPPPEIKKHPKWHCLMRRPGGWYWIHHTKHTDLSSAILEIESILNQSLDPAKLAALKSGNPVRDFLTRYL